MKKTIAILLVLVIGMAGVFAANTADLELKTTVAGKYGLKITDDAISVENLSNVVSTFNNATAVPDVSFSNEILSKTLYINYYSNQRIRAKVTTTMAPMTSETVTNKIGYIVYVGDNPTTVDSEDTAEAITFFDEGSTSHGMRVNSQAFKITMDSGDWNAAGAAEYTTTWTVELTTLT